MIYINKQLNGKTEVILNAENFPWLFKNHELGGVQLTDFVCEVVGDDIEVQTTSLSDIPGRLKRALFKKQRDLSKRLNELNKQINEINHQLTTVKRTLKETGIYENSNI